MFMICDFDIRIFIVEAEYPKFLFDENIMITYSGGNKHYHPIYLDAKSKNLYVGSMNSILKLNLYNISDISSKFSQITILPLKQDVDICISKFGLDNQAYDCQNHFRVIQKMSDGKIYACSTGSHSPKDYLFSTNLDNYTNYPPDGIGIGKCPYDPRSSHAYILSEKNNPLNQAMIYSGTYRDIDKLDAFIYRPPIYDESGQKQISSFMRTASQSLKVLNEPQFIKAIEVDNCVYFFFNEIAVEYNSCFDSIIPRVARICKKDRGGLSVSTNFWATYIKARLNCSHTSNQKSFKQTIYFNKLRDIFTIKNSESQHRFYALFTAFNGDKIGSAICLFNIFDVDEALKSNFIRRPHTFSSWDQVPSTEIPEIISNNRECSNKTDTLSWNEEAIYFMNEHPMVQNSVNQENHEPIFFHNNLELKKIIVDQIVGFDKAHPYYVIFAISVRGDMYKITYWYDANGRYSSQIVSSYQIITNSNINSIDLLPGKYIYVTMNNSINQISLALCEKYELCSQCIRDPYCGWDKYAGSCKKWDSSKSSKLLQSVRTKNDGLCVTNEKVARFKVSNIMTIPGSSVHMKCKFPSYLTNHDIKDQINWFYNNNIIPYDNTLILTNDMGLILLGLNISNAGSYSCKYGQQILSKYDLNINNEVCSIPQTKEKYNEKYNEWCREFENYKREFYDWQKKKKECIFTNSIS
ncbi:semaphorin-2A-like isoform X1 [Gordionus sp. m RMFG-2023]|uniref:semaphorin-2A-like isoform X1 n=2 Tax=Gordionus sp. m RMFG-2023 TaxID=3053472 RepID=UPI0031FD8236